jgi:hypothetical protein
MFIERSPPTLPAFAPVIDDYGCSSLSDKILDGMADLNQLDVSEEVKWFLERLKMTDDEKRLEVPARMTAEQFSEGMKTTNEMTSSSPSGLHITLWKAIAEDEGLADTHSLWMSLPFMFGFVCNRWKHIIDCMLEKKTGMQKIHMMRIITLIEAEFNSTLKFYYSKNIMPNTEETDLSPDQWGGRKDRSAPACAMRKVITWEYARYTKTVLGSFFGDLQSNFDRMMRELSSYVSRKKGLPKSAAKCRAMTIAGMVRSVRTAWGTSKGSYQEGTGEHPCGGECQGKGDTMALWILFLDILLLIHKKMPRDQNG